MLQSTVLARNMGALRAKARTGRLAVDAGDTRTFVYFREGRTIFAEEGTQGETLGRLLVRQQLLTQEQYLVVLSRMSDALFSNEQIRFGETAVELGYLSEEQVHTALVDQVRWKIVRCFLREELTWTFVDGESFVEEVPELPMSLEGLVFDAVQWLDREQNLESGLGKLIERFVFVPTDERATFAKAFRIDPALVRGLDALAGQRRARDLLGNPPLPDFPIEAVLTTLAILHPAGFLDAPYVERRIEPAVAAPQRPQASSPLAPGVQLPQASSPLAPGVQLPQASAPVAARAPLPSQPQASAPLAPRAPLPSQPHTHPSASPAVAPSMNRTRVSQVLQRIAEQPVPRGAVEAHFREPKGDEERRLLAEQAYQHGRRHLDAGRGPQARMHLHRAMQLEPGSKEYAFVAEWGDARERLSTDAVAATRLRRNVVELLRLDPGFAYGFFVAGYLQFIAEDYPAAKRYLSRALSLDPTLTDAVRYLRLTESRMPKPTR